MHDNDRKLDQKTIESDRKVTSELEARIYNAGPPEFELARERFTGRARAIGRGILRFFTKEEFLFLKISELRPEDDIPDSPEGLRG